MGNEEIDDANFGVFRDCLFEVVVGKLSPASKTKKRLSKQRVPLNKNPVDPEVSATTNDPTELADFSDFIAGDIFSNLPSKLKSLSHQALEDDPELAEKWSLPLSLSVFEELAEGVDPAVADSLIAYGLIEPPKSDLQSFISPVINSYISVVTIPPPKWVATKTSACEICDREWVPLTYHHLIPKEVHSKVLKRGWHNERMLNSVAWLCRACHTFVHQMASNEELAKDWFTVELICSRDDVQKWAKWVGKVRWKKR